MSFSLSPSFRFRRSCNRESATKNPSLRSSLEPVVKKPTYEIKEGGEDTYYTEINYQRTFMNKTMADYKMKRSVHDSVDDEQYSSSCYTQMFEQPTIKVEQWTTDSSGEKGDTKHRLEPKIKITYKNSNKQCVKDVYLRPELAYYQDSRALKRRVSDVQSDHFRLDMQDVCYQHTDYEAKA